MITKELVVQPLRIFPYQLRVSLPGMQRLAVVKRSCSVPGLLVVRLPESVKAEAVQVSAVWTLMARLASCSTHTALFVAACHSCAVPC